MMIKELEGAVFVAIGRSEVRKELVEWDNNRHFSVLIHLRAVVAEDVIIGNGTVTKVGAGINSGTRIGKDGIVNTPSFVDHDCAIGDYCHVSVESQ